MLEEIKELAKTEASAVLGSLLGVLIYFRQLEWWLKGAYFIGGWGLAHIFAAQVQSIGSFALGTAQCIAALFSLAIIEKLFDVWRNFDAKQVATDLWAALLKRLGGS